MPDNMQAGAEMDELVAKDIMGTVPCDQWVMFTPFSVYLPTGICPKHGRNKCHPDKERGAHYSKNISAAWQVFQHIRKNWPFSQRRAFFNELQKLISAEHKDLKGLLIAYPDVFLYVEPVHFCRAALRVVKEGRITRRCPAFRRVERLG